MKKLTALIIDDEEGAITTLSGMLTEFCQNIEILGVASSITKAVIMTEEMQPDLVFLDIEMPPAGSGFDFIRLVKKKNFEVIFTTAYPQYAVKAINSVQPLAYLIKPYSVTELLDAVQTALEKKVNLNSLKSTTTSMEQGFTVPSGRKANIVIHFKDIMYCKADKMISEIYTYRNENVSKINAYISLRGLEEELPSALFFRTHHSFIVNFNFVHRIEVSAKGGSLQLIDGTIISISATYSKEFKEAFDLFLKGR